MLINRAFYKNADFNQAGVCWLVQIMIFFWNFKNQALSFNENRCVLVFPFCILLCSLFTFLAIARSVL